MPEALSQCFLNLFDEVPFIFLNLSWTDNFIKYNKIELLGKNKKKTIQNECLNVLLDSIKSINPIG